ncbi:uncharacterized protein LOC142573062 isoform X1 [Dermacentor variabilis]|uniref:uncharacterized protein LOC142573062 isoform X1 n=1 Tax=Dermacentor variabilis TaxID=34621 RepID=UPI003F5C1B0B
MLLSGSIFIICLSFGNVRCGKLAVCGKSPGIRTASRSAALASKIMQKCARKLVRRFTVPTSVIIKMAEKACLGIRLCYAYENRSDDKNTSAMKQRVRNCMEKGATAFYAGNPEKFSLTLEQFKAFVEYCRHCIDDSLLPENVSVLLGAVRYLLKSANLASPVL